jgi:hypothetical protein
MKRRGGHPRFVVMRGRVVWVVAAGFCSFLVFVIRSIRNRRDGMKSMMASNALSSIRFASATSRDDDADSGNAVDSDQTDGSGAMGDAADDTATEGMKRTSPANAAGRVVADGGDADKESASTRRSLAATRFSRLAKQSA